MENGGDGLESRRTLQPDHGVHDRSEAGRGALAERDLPEGPASVFAGAHPILAELLGEASFRVGGGTALAAVWAHRHSTDVDLFADHSAYAGLVASESSRQSLSDGLREALQPDEIEIRRGTLKLACPAGELSIITTPSPLPPLAATDRVAGTNTELERPATILARKLHGRMLTNGVLVLRDLYDLAAARDLAPGDLRLALGSLSKDDRRQIVDELRHLPADWAASPGKSGRAVIRAARPTELARDPSRAILTVRKLLSEEDY